MANKNLVSHITGLNFSYSDTPRPGSFFQADGAPGVLAGPTEGFSVAFGMRPTPKTSVAIASADTSPFTAEDLDEFGLPPTSILPTAEVVAGTHQISSSTGWGIGVDAEQIGVQLGSTEFTLDLDNPCLRTDMIVLMSFVGDATEYGGGANTGASISVNGALSVLVDASFTYAQSILPFCIGGSEDPDLAGVVGFGGMADGLLNSLWVTPGIPTIQQANAFFEASMQAGRVIPQRWPGIRTAQDPDPELPDSPTGSFYLAPDAELEVGGTWTDRLSEVPLTLGGNAAGEPGQLGEARFVGRQANYWTADPS